MLDRLNERLTKLRKEKGFSQQSFAKAMHVSRSTISMWEIGQRKPGIDELIEISKVLDVSYSDLLPTDLPDESDNTFINEALSRESIEVNLNDRYVVLQDLVKPKGYYFVQYDDGTFGLNTPDGGCYTISEEDAESVRLAAEKAAALQFEIIAHREHQVMLEGLIKNGIRKPSDA